MKVDSEQLIQERVQDLRENTDFASALFDNLVGYAIVAADFDGNLLAYNEGARRIYGYTPEQIVGRQDFEIFFPREFIHAGNLQRIIADLVEHGTFSYEGEKIRENGDSFPAQILFTLTKDKYGQVVGFIEIVQDLTERKRAEAAEAVAHANAARIEQLERERAEAVRNRQHYQALSQRPDPEGLDSPPALGEETLHELILDYWDIVTHYVRAVRIKEDRPTERVRQFAGRLAALRARARDVVRIHLGGLDRIAQHASPAENRNFSNDARLVLVELMGNLMDIYSNAGQPRDPREARQN